jgi:hypothetical protein
MVPCENLRANLSEPPELQKIQLAATEKEYYRQTLIDAHWMIPQADFHQLFTKIYGVDAA